MCFDKNNRCAKEVLTDTALGYEHPPPRHTVTLAVLVYFVLEKQQALLYLRDAHIYQICSP